MKAGSLVFCTTFASFLADPCASFPLLSSGYCQSNWPRVTCPVCMLARTFQNVILGKKPFLAPPCFYLWLCIPGTERLFIRSIGAICSGHYSRAWKPDSYGQFSVITLIWHLFLPQFTDIMVTIHSWNKYLRFAGLRWNSSEDKRVCCFTERPNIFPIVSGRVSTGWCVFLLLVILLSTPILSSPYYFKLKIHHVKQLVSCVKTTDYFIFQ